MYECMYVLLVHEFNIHQPLSFPWTTPGNQTEHLKLPVFHWWWMVIERDLPVIFYENNDKTITSTVHECTDIHMYVHMYIHVHHQGDEWQHFGKNSKKIRKKIKKFIYYHDSGSEHRSCTIDNGLFCVGWVVQVRHMRYRGWFGATPQHYRRLLRI